MPSFTNFLILLFGCISTWNSIIALPTGIPIPPIDLSSSKPSLPTNWSNEIPGYYYIDSSKGTDNNRVYGNPNAPRHSIPNPVPAGSLVIVNGLYTVASGGVTHLNGRGNSQPWEANISGPVWIAGSDNETAIFNRKTILYGNDVYIENLSFLNGGTLQVSSASTDTFAANNILVRNLTITGDGQSLQTGLSITGTSNIPTTNIVIDNCTISNFGDVTASYDQDSTCAIIANHSKNIWLLNSTMHTSSGPGVRTGGAYQSDHPSSCSNIYVGNNHIYNTRQSGMNVKYAKNVVYSNNFIHDVINTDWSASKAISAQYAPDGLWILYNTLYNCRYGIRISSTNSGQEWPIYAIGNLIYSCESLNDSYNGGSWDESAIHMQGGTPRYIINNTLAHSASGINISGTGTNYIENNIIYCITELNGHSLNIEHTNSTTTFRNNLIYNCSNNSLVVKYGSGTYSITQFNNTLSTISDNIYHSPGLNQNLTLQTGSIAIDNALNPDNLSSNIYTLYLEIFGVDIQLDRAGNIRNNKWDIGAFELNSTIPTIDKNLPNLPSNLTIR